MLGVRGSEGIKTLRKITGSIFRVLGMFTRFSHGLRFNTTLRWHHKATKYRWYKKWHDYRFSHHVHVAAALIYIFALSVGFLGNIFITPQQLYAANGSATQTTFNGSDGTYTSTAPANSGADVALDGVLLSNPGGGNWKYKRPVTVTNSSGGALTDYQVQVSPFTDSAFVNNTGLVGSWHLNGGTTGAISTGAIAGLQDSSGSTNNGTASNTNGTGMAWAPGKYNGAVSFDGVDDKITLATNPTSGTGSFSMFAWIKTTVSGTRRQIINYGADVASQGAWLFVNTANQVEFDLVNVGGPTSAVTVNDGGWHFVGAVNNAGSVQIYVDGVASGSAVAMSPNITAGAITPTIGGPTGAGSSYSWFFNGQIDEVTVFSRALVASEVSNRYTILGSPKIKDDYADLRFTKADGTELPYWRENDGKYWIKYSGSLATGDSTINMYYGNSSATSSSNGTSTFIAFDDFSDGIQSGWTDVAGTWTEANGIRSQTSTAAAVLKYSYMPITGLTDYVVTAKVRVPSSFGTSSRMGVLLDRDTTNIHEATPYATTPTTQVAVLEDNVTWSTAVNTGMTLTTNTWFEIDGYRGVNTMAARIYSPAYTSIPAWQASWARTTFSNTHVGLTGGYDGAVDFDDFRVRKYAAVEPTNSAPGVETTITPTAGTYTTLALPTVTAHQGKVYGWGNLAFTNTLNAQTITYDILDGATGNAIVGYTGITVSPTSIAGISATTHPSLKVRANLSGNGTATPLLNDLTLAYSYDATAPTIPGSVTVGTTTQNSIALSWGGSTDAESGVAGYEIQRAADSSGNPGTWIAAAGTCSGLITVANCTDSGLSSNVKYWYKVRAKDNAGNYSSYTGGLLATGGTITYTDSNGLNPRTGTPYVGGFVVQTFTASGTLSVQSGGTAEALVVAGGGGGASGGGGAGGVISTSSIDLSGNMSITVGNGGAAGCTNNPCSVGAYPGGNSVLGNLTAIGGGAGAGVNNQVAFAGANNGGSGGGAGYSSASLAGGTGTSGQGYAGGSNLANGGYPTGGGGGAGGVGGNSVNTNLSGAGGVGISSSITGVATMYAAGGGGGIQTGTAGLGGSGIGGNGSAVGNGTAGVANTGSGGGGGKNFNAYYGGAGGSGIVVIRYPYNSTSLTTVTTLTGTPVIGVLPYSNSQKPAYTNSSNPDLSFANQIIRLYVDGVFKVSTTANASGVFTFSDANYTSAGYTMPEGDHSVYAVAMNSGSPAAESAASNTVTTRVDITAPADPAVVPTAWDGSSKTRSFSSNGWGNIPTLYFEWAATNDLPVLNPSGLKRYHLYFGNNATAIPKDLGTPTTATETNAVRTLASPTTGATYYARLQGEDNAGNFSNPVTIFTYKYDSVAPSGPTTIVPTPAGWTQTNSFNFEWSNWTEADSGIDYYLFVRKLTSGAETYEVIDPVNRKVADNINPINLNGVTALYSGTNVLRIYAVDMAGNVSTVYGSSPYFYSGSVAGPASLAATPQFNSTNSFSFSWTKPVGVTPKGYYCGVSSPLSIENTTYIDVVTPPSTVTMKVGSQLVPGVSVVVAGDSVTLGAFAAASAQGQNTFYCATKDNNDSVGWAAPNPTSVNFTINTPAPDVPQGLKITDASDRGTQNWALTVGWTDLVNKTTDFKGYEVWRCTASCDVEANFNDKRGTVVSNIFSEAGLSNTTDYYYKIKSVDNVGKTSNFSTSVHKMPTGKFVTAPAYTSDPTSAAKALSVQVSWTTNRPSNTVVQYGTTTSYGQEASKSTEAVTDHSIEILGLTPGVLYHYRVQSLDAERDYDPATAFSGDFTFQTLAAPGISDVQISEIRLTSAIITWKTTSSATSKILYGTTTSYGKQYIDNSGSQTTTHTVKLGSLSDSTTYNLKIMGTDIDGNSLSSDNYVFTTLTFPKLSNLRVEQVKNTPTSTVRVSFTSNVPTTSQVIATGNGGKEASIYELKTDHQLTISGLRDNTSYVVTAKARDQYGNEAVPLSANYKTEFDTRPPEISEITTENSIVGYGAEAKGQIVVSWNTDEPATSQVEYGAGASGTEYASKTQADTAYTTNHVVIISDLNPSSAYHFRVLSSDNAKNEAKSTDGSVLTDQANESVIDVIIKSLQTTIGWIFTVFRK